MLPCFRASVLPCFCASVLPCFRASASMLLYQVHASMIDFILMQITKHDTNRIPASLFAYCIVPTYLTLTLLNLLEAWSCVAEIHSVVYRFFTPPSCPVSVNTNQNFLRYRYFISVLLWVFFTVWFGGNTFWRFCGNSFFENLAELHFSPQKEGEVYKRGPKPPPFSLGKGGSR